MPGSDASQFTRFKKAAANQGDPSSRDPKANKLVAQYLTPLSVASNQNKFLASLTIKNLTPLIQAPINTDFAGKKEGLKQNCS